MLFAGFTVTEFQFSPQTFPIYFSDDGRSFPTVSPAHYLEKESQQCRLRALNNLFVSEGRLTCSIVLWWWGGEVRGQDWGEDWGQEDDDLSLPEPPLPPLWSPGSRGGRQARPQRRRCLVYFDFCSAVLSTCQQNKPQLHLSRQEIFCHWRGLPVVFSRTICQQ